VEKAVDWLGVVGCAPIGYSHHYCGCCGKNMKVHKEVNTPYKMAFVLIYAWKGS